MRQSSGVIAGLLCGLLVAACSSQRSNQSSLTPSAPTPVAVSSTAAVADSPGRSPSLPTENAIGVQAIAFPPRNEPLDFRIQLDTKYRDSLRRSAVASFVDIEGAIVWTQEYLRYRLNGCGHADAVDRVFRQIDGFGVQPVCGLETPDFPPRNQPFDFRVLLEAKYRDGLRRGPTSTFVDTEGDIVWTQEYLRYRVSGCLHTDAVSRVFAQIDGRGVQPDCRTTAVPTPTPSSAGRYRGSVRITSCAQSGSFSTINYCGDFFTGLTDSLDLTLTQSGNNVSGSLNLGGVVFSVSGTLISGQLRLSGQSNVMGLVFTLDSWVTTISGTSLSGTFAWNATFPGLSGSGRSTFTLVNVSRTADIGGPTTFEFERTPAALGLSEALSRSAGKLRR